MDLEIDIGIGFWKRFLFERILMERKEIMRDLMDIKEYKIRKGNCMFTAVVEAPIDQPLVTTKSN